ncbi:hypothetical protein I4U23_002643 [Adineta vaga]|nr:hypothetical protein I4U23_002643 [Adineta vaga]
MADAGFFKGTSADQDSRFANKQKKLLKQMKFPDNIDVKVDMLKVNLDVIKPWITMRLQELLGIEDDVVIEFVFNQLEDKNPDPKMMQINLTGFLGGSKARLFIGELWKILSDAQASPDGIPAELVEMKKKELLKRQEEDDRLREIRKREEDSHRQDIKPALHKLDNKTNFRQSLTSANNKSRNENGNNAGYKSRQHYGDNRRRSPPKLHRTRDSHSPEMKSRRSDKNTTQSVVKNSETKDDHHRRHENRKLASTRHRFSSKSPSHSRSPIKSSQKPVKREKRSSSSSSAISNASHQESKKSQKTKSKPGSRSSSSNSSVNPSHEKTKKPSSNMADDHNQSSKLKKKHKSLTPSPPRSNKKDSVLKSMANIDKVKPKVSPAKETKKTKKNSKRDRSTSSNSSSTSRSKSNSSYSTSSSSDSEIDKRRKQKKKAQSKRKNSSSRSRSRSSSHHRRSTRKKDDHRSRKHSIHDSKSSSKKRTKHHQSNDTNRKSHRDRPDRSSNRKIHRDESPSSSSSKNKKNNDTDNEKKIHHSHRPTSDNKSSKLSTPPKKVRLESQIRVQTPPPPTSKLPVEKISQKELAQPSSTPIKSNRTERIVLLEDSRTDDTSSISTRVSIMTKTVSDEKHSNNGDNNNNSSSEDENEIDLRERLLREKAIKSMRQRQLTNPNNNNNINTKTTTSDRIVYDLH